MSSASPSVSILSTWFYIWLAVIIRGQNNVKMTCLRVKKMMPIFVLTNLSCTFADRKRARSQPPVMVAVRLITAPAGMMITF